MPSTSGAGERQHLFSPQYHINNSSSSSSIVTVQRANSVGPDRSTPRPLAAPHESHAPTYASNGTANFSKPVTSPESRRRQSASHSRSNSFSGVRDGIGNLNRWSQSTTSSRGSTPHTRSNSFSRRMSLGGAGAFAFGSSNTQSPNKSQKSKSTAGEGSPRQQSTSRPLDASLHLATSLPPIITLPALQPIDNNRSSPLTAASNTPSTAGLLSAAVRSTVPDYFGKAWDETSPRDFSNGKGPLRDRSPIDTLQSSATASSRQPPNASPARRHRQEIERSSSRGHSRNRSQAGKTSSGTASSDRSKDRAAKQPSQKAMLSVALQKANTAVLLDNAQNVEGAMQAYSEACNLLQQVMLRSSGDEDKRKLEAIRNTYAIRIKELEKMAPPPANDGKALPARPPSTDSRDFENQSPVDDEMVEIGTAMVTMIVNDDSYRPGPPRQISPSQVPKRRESLLPSAFDSPTYNGLRGTSNSPYPPRSFSSSPMREKVTEMNMKPATPMEQGYMPPPLAARRPTSPMDRVHTTQDAVRRHGVEQGLNTSNLLPEQDHRRPASVESMSWLDMIDGSVSSSSSSVHSRTSSLAIRRKHIRAASGATEAEFDAALDAAVEAAYDDGLEPMDELEPSPDVRDYDDEVVANVRRRVEQAKERVRQAARETAAQLAQDRERRAHSQEKDLYQILNGDYDANESEEEERILEEMTRGFIMDDFEFGLQSKSALPRESDSSGFSGRTWNSSIGSNVNTAGTSLSTVAETLDLPEMPSLMSKTPPHLHPPPAQALPHPPPTEVFESLNVPNSHPTAPISTQSVRNRRLSGQNPKHLKIETTPKVSTAVAAPLAPPNTAPPQSNFPSEGPPPLPIGTVSQSRQAQGTATVRPPVPQFNRQASSPFPGPSTTETISPPTPTFNRVANSENDSGMVLPRSGSPGRAQSRTGLRKNFSSSSLKNLKSRNLSVSAADDGSDLSPNTPLNSHFGGSSKDMAGKVPAMPTLPTPIAASFKEKMNGVPTGGLYLFDSDINSPQSPSSPGLSKAGGPIPLEPCPTEVLLRPFWLMRALYQTLAHPRGGYLSTKLFVPTDVWRVKGVKIRNLEDKISNCDYLTAALQKLAQVDTCDADAVLEEMQALEGVLEQVQATLAKKLGNEVGVQGSGMLFRDAPTGGEGDSNNSGSKTPGGSSKSSSFSWRRLRSKNSGAGLTNTYSNKAPAVEGPKEGLTMSTLPMTTLSNIRFAKRDVNSAQFTGPHANYMAALARLFDAAQAIDQIARQVDDPGLRHADKTQVGLELCTRHAAEFFGFYVCRFVLADLSLLLDKFIKRGSEWVLV